MKVALNAQGLGKAYRNYGNEWRRILSWIFTNVKPLEEKWVLRNINFSIHQGQAVGIIGRNGAGKSSLLKLITGTLKPTSGTITLNGRVAALLELGMGFHPELTGRENAYNAGGLMGHSKKRIDEVISEIEEFAEIGAYFNEPVRSYSSGMQMRLAFSVATAIRPDILIVDEALSVGDAYFQHKCFRRIREFKDHGTTLLFVSHDPAAVRTLCDHAILLEGGELIRAGKPDEILDYYNALIAQREDRALIEQRAGITRSGTGEARICSAILGGTNGSKKIFITGEPLSVELSFEILKPLEDLTLGILIRDRLGNDVFGTNTFNLGIALHTYTDNKGIKNARFIIDKLHLGPGSYSITLALHAGYEHTAGNYDWWDGVLTFEVICPTDRPFIGVASLPVRFEIT